MHASVDRRSACLASRRVFVSRLCFLLLHLRGAACLTLTTISPRLPASTSPQLNPTTLASRSDRVSLLAGTFRHRLNVVTLGFASDEQDFSVLESMAEAARAAGAKGSFQRPELSSAGLASALSSAISSLTETKTTLASTLAAPAGRVGAGAGGGVGVGPRSLPPIQEFQKESADSEHQDGWVVYADEVERMEYRPESVDGVEEHPWQVQRFFSPEADAIAIRKNPFGEGAERLVYKMQVCVL